MKRIASLDGFRAISILLVLFHHSRFSIGFPHRFDELARQAEVGVTIFFVISGFLITNLLLTEQSKNGAVNLKGFYYRRILRIIPVYILYVFFLLLWQHIEDLSLDKFDLIHVLTFTENFASRKNWFIGHFWTLSIEEQFYLFWPLLVILFKKHLKVILFILCIYSCVARVLVYKHPGIEMLMLGQFFQYSDAIFIGSFGGIMYFEKPEILQHRFFKSYLAQLVALCLFLTFVYFTEHGMLAVISLPFGRSIISASTLFIILSYIRPSDKMIFKILNNKVVIHIGILSYSIYIWQQFFFTGNIKGLWRMFPYNWIVIYFVSLASYYLWETQFLKLKRHFSIKRLHSVS
jgi:peptidoglycan/LPS O-acetylase OafA/YrhL